MLESLESIRIALYIIIGVLIAMTVDNIHIHYKLDCVENILALAFYGVIEDDEEEDDDE